MQLFKNKLIYKVNKMNLIFTSKKLPELCNNCFRHFVSAYGIYCIYCKTKFIFMEKIENIKNNKKIYFNLQIIRNSKIYNEYKDLLYILSIYLQKIDLLLKNFRIYKINIIDLYFSNVNKIINLLSYLLQINKSKNFKLFSPNTNTFLLLHK